jgi:small-conductance mechanosensitive channel
MVKLQHSDERLAQSVSSFRISLIMFSGIAILTSAAIDAVPAYHDANEGKPLCAHWASLHVSSLALGCANSIAFRRRIYRNKGLTEEERRAELRVVSESLSTYMPLILAVIWVVLGFAAGVIVDRVALPRVAQTRMVAESFWLSSSAVAVRGVAVLWGTIAGLYAALETVNLSTRIDFLIGRVLLVLILGSATLVAARFAAGAISHYGGGVEKRLLSASLFASVAETVVVIFGVLIILNSLGIAITPLLTALGVGGLAVALALKDTLANLFSGIQIVASRQLRPGDYVKLESGFEGIVEDVNWRNTTIRELPNNLIVIPNDKLAQSIFTNYHLPEAELTVSVPVAVAYGNDLDEVERVALEAAGAALDDMNTSVRDQPYVRFRELGDSTVSLTVHMRAPQFQDQFKARSYLIKRLYDGLNRAGLGPVPQRVPRKSELGRL